MLINSQLGRLSASRSVLTVRQFPRVVLGNAVQVCFGSTKQDWQGSHLYSTGKVGEMH